LDGLVGEFIFGSDLADEFLEKILGSHDPGGRAMLVDNDRKTISGESALIRSRSLTRTARLLSTRAEPGRPTLRWPAWPIVQRSGP
jgi:hypothetical protein